MRILICEDEEILITALELRLRKHGFEVDIFNAKDSLFEYISRTKPDLVVVSLAIETTSIEEILLAFQQQVQMVPTIIIGDAEEGEILLKLLKKGASDFMLKPFKPAELVLRIRKVLEL